MGRLTRQLVRLIVRSGGRSVGVAVLVLFGLSYALSYMAGGASRLPPHGFYIPLAILGVRCGLRTTAVGALVAAVLAGPVLPAVVADGVAQDTSDWVARGVFFVVVSSITTALARAAVEEELSAYGRTLHELELYAALDRGQFELCYQPIVRLDDCSVVGGEALVRWSHPERGVIGPDQFIPLAERSGLIDRLGAWVLTQVVKDMRAWQREEDGSVPISYVSVNASRSQFRPDGLLVPTIDALGRNEPLPTRLVVEVTETGFVEDQVGLVDRLVQLQLRGVEIAMDDYGTGHSTLLSVKDLPLDVIKIDRSFVSGIDDNPSLRSLVANTIELARALGKKVVAEGVETDAERAALLDLGVLTAQGYLFSAALPIEEFRPFVASHLTVRARGRVGHRILVVDDREGDHLFVATLLDDWGQLDFARSGSEAVELASDVDYTIVLLDIQMPGMSGFDTARALRSIYEQRAIERPVIVGLSARDLPEDEQAAIDAGMDAYLSKPLSIERLEQAVAQVSRRRSPTGPVPNGPADLRVGGHETSR